MRNWSRAHPSMPSFPFVRSAAASSVRGVHPNLWERAARGIGDMPSRAISGTPAMVGELCPNLCK